MEDCGSCAQGTRLKHVLDEIVARPRVMRASLFDLTEVKGARVTRHSIHSLASTRRFSKGVSRPIGPMIKGLFPLRPTRPERWSR